MNRTLFLAIFLALVTISCNKNSSEVAPDKAAQASTTPASSNARTAARDSSGNSVFISIEDANEMIDSYLKSRSNNDANAAFGPDIKSYSINADALREYLEDPNVKNIKVCFAHTQSYIDAGNSGKPAGYQSGAVTLILVGYDATGNYIYHNNAVLDHLAPCPYSCPPGYAGSDLLQ